MEFVDLDKIIEAFKLVDIDSLQNLLQINMLGFGLSIGIFLIIILLNLLSKYKIFTLRRLIAWALSTIITFIYISNDDIGQNMKAVNMNAQVILGFVTNAVMLMCYLLSLISNKPRKRGKNYGKHTWWVSILGFVVLLAFYSVFNIALFAFALFFYL